MSMVTFQGRDQKCMKQLTAIQLMAHSFNDYVQLDNQVEYSLAFFLFASGYF